MFDSHLIHTLMQASLDGKVFLRMRNFRLARIAVLGNQVAGEAGEVVVINAPGTSRSETDHFANIGKMVVRKIF